MITNKRKGPREAEEARPCAKIMQIAVYLRAINFIRGKNFDAMSVMNDLVLVREE